MDAPCTEDSRSKLALGRLWAQLAGPEYRYFMVFETDATGFDGAYTLAEFKTEILEEIQ